MAKWQDDDDILRDFDTLSGIESPKQKPKPYSSWGRGQSIQIPTSEPEQPVQKENVCKEEFQWFTQGYPVECFPENLSRGKKLEVLRENMFCVGKEFEVKDQLRRAIGPGYSNEFIEESFRQRIGKRILKQTETPPSEQFEDPEEIKNSSMSTAARKTETSLNVASTSAKTPSPVSEGSSQMVSEGAKCEGNGRKHKRKQRRYRNVALDSLEKLERETKTTSYSEETRKIGEKVQNSRGQSATLSDKTKNKEKNNDGNALKFPPPCYRPHKHINREPFVYNDTDFPEL